MREGSKRSSRSHQQVIEEKIQTISGETITRRYTRGRLLGKGGFAKCYEVTNMETREVLAAKIIAKSSLKRKRAKQKLLSEIKIHRSLSQSNVVKVERVFEDQENVYILMELCPNQTLKELVKRRKRLTEFETQVFTLQIVQGLKYLHKCNVIHRDIKLGNLFLGDKMHVKMGDFGLACKLEYEGQKRKTICGTPNYIAPEILRKKGHCYEVDLWSLGVIIYAMLIGRPPFETSEVKKTYERIKKNAYSFPDYIPISDQAKSLIARLLVLDPSKRLTLDEILQHQFMENWQNLPDHLPLSIHACPPSLTFMRQFAPKTSHLRSSQRSLFNSKQNFHPGNTQMSEIAQQKTGGMKSYASNRKLKTQGQFPQVNNQQNNFYATMKATSGEKQEVYVKKWVDYSSKYGLGYLLSNGSSGVFFNDSTKIILDPLGGYFEYMERKPNEKIDIVSTHTFQNYPKTLEKKVTLLKHFRSYLDANKQAESKSLTTEELKEKKTQILNYVKKWMKTKHAIMFRLSNKIVQVDFTDKTEIILSTKSKMVTYVNKKGEKSYYPFAKAFESKNGEMARRLKYTKEILTYINKKNTQRKPQF